MERSTSKYQHEVTYLFRSVEFWLILFNVIHSYLLRFITFQRFDYFVNPARADPAWFDTFTMDHYLYTIRTRRDHKICLCLSPVFVVKSRLLEAHSRSSKSSTGNAMLVKSLDCVFHSYEWERSSSFWCTVFGVETMEAQMKGSVISIETKPSNPDSKSYLPRSMLCSDVTSQIWWT